MGTVSVRRRAPSTVRTKLKFIILEKVAFAPDVYGLSLMEMSNREASLGEYCRDYGEQNERRRCCGCRRVRRCGGGVGRPESCGRSRPRAEGYPKRDPPRPPQGPTP